ncbi:MAG: hypothetical protein PUC66_03310 [Erysipelotrichaceae bacterium]|nr:hypothetical protein [Erysipelotrichaceae bacterium]
MEESNPQNIDESTTKPTDSSQASTPEQKKPNAKKKDSFSDSSPSDTSRRYARRQKQKRVALIVTSVGAVGTLMLGIIAFLGRVSGQFTIRLDKQTISQNLKLSEHKSAGTPSDLLVASGLENAYVTTAKDVLSYVDTLKGEEELDGSHNFSRTLPGEEGKSTNLALVYTFYAINSSAADSISYNVSMAIDNYTSPTNYAVQPYSYLRVALFENVCTAEGEEETQAFTVYASANQHSQGTNPGGAEDYRECLSDYSTVDGLRMARYDYDGNHGYCEEFEGNMQIFDRPAVTLLARQTMRYTVVVWLEGADPECYGQAPEGASFTFTMTFAAANNL